MRNASVLRLVMRWPHLGQFVHGDNKTFPVAIHGDDGTGLNEESTLLLTWSVGWHAGRQEQSTWLLRFPFAVLPHGRALPESMPLLLELFVLRQWGGWVLDFRLMVVVVVMAMSVRRGVRGFSLIW